MRTLIKLANQELLLLGDMNSRMGKENNDKVAGGFGKDIINDSGRRLVSLCKQN